MQCFIRPSVISSDRNTTTTAQKNFVDQETLTLKQKIIFFPKNESNSTSFIQTALQVILRNKSLIEAVSKHKNKEIGEAFQNFFCVYQKAGFGMQIEEIPIYNELILKLKEMYDTAIAQDCDPISRLDPAARLIKELTLHCSDTTYQYVYIPVPVIPVPVDKETNIDQNQNFATFEGLKKNLKDIETIVVHTGDTSTKYGRYTVYNNVSSTTYSNAWKTLSVDESISNHYAGKTLDEILPKGEHQGPIWQQNNIVFFSCKEGTCQDLLASFQPKDKHLNSAGSNAENSYTIQNIPSAPLHTDLPVTVTALATPIRFPDDVAKDRISDFLIQVDTALSTASNAQTQEQLLQSRDILIDHIFNYITPKASHFSLKRKIQTHISKQKLISFCKKNLHLTNASCKKLLSNVNEIKNLCLENTINTKKDFDTCIINQLYSNISNTLNTALESIFRDENSINKHEKYLEIKQFFDEENKTQSRYPQLSSQIITARIHMKPCDLKAYFKQCRELIRIKKNHCLKEFFNATVVANTVNSSTDPQAQYFFYKEIKKILNSPSSPITPPPTVTETCLITNASDIQIPEEQIEEPVFFSRRKPRKKHSAASNTNSTNTAVQLNYREELTKFRNIPHYNEEILQIFEAKLHDTINTNITEYIASIGKNIAYNSDANSLNLLKHLHDEPTQILEFIRYVHDELENCSPITKEIYFIISTRWEQNSLAIDTEEHKINCAKEIIKRIIDSAESDVIALQKTLIQQLFSASTPHTASASILDKIFNQPSFNALNFITCVQEQLHTQNYCIAEHQYNHLIRIINTIFSKNPIQDIATNKTAQELLNLMADTINKIDEKNLEHKEKNEELIDTFINKITSPLPPQLTYAEAVYIKFITNNNIANLKLNHVLLFTPRFYPIVHKILLSKLETHSFNTQEEQNYQFYLRQIKQAIPETLLSVVLEERQNEIGIDLLFELLSEIIQSNKLDKEQLKDLKSFIINKTKAVTKISDLMKYLELYNLINRINLRSTELDSYYKNRIHESLRKVKQDNKIVPDINELNTFSTVILESIKNQYQNLSTDNTQKTIDELTKFYNENFQNLSENCKKDFATFLFEKIIPSEFNTTEIAQIFHSELLHLIFLNINRTPEKCKDLFSFLLNTSCDKNKQKIILKIEHYINYDDSEHSKKLVFIKYLLEKHRPIYNSLSIFNFANQFIKQQTEKMDTESYSSELIKNIPLIQTLIAKASDKEVVKAHLIHLSERHEAELRNSLIEMFTSLRFSSKEIIEIIKPLIESTTRKLNALVETTTLKNVHVYETSKTILKCFSYILEILSDDFDFSDFSDFLNAFFQLDATEEPDKKTLFNEKTQFLKLLDIEKNTSYQIPDDLKISVTDTDTNCIQTFLTKLQELTQYVNKIVAMGCAQNDLEKKEIATFLRCINFLVPDSTQNFDESFFEDLTDNGLKAIVNSFNERINNVRRAMNGFTTFLSESERENYKNITQEITTAFNKIETLMGGIKTHLTVTDVAIESSFSNHSAIRINWNEIQAMKTKLESKKTALENLRNTASTQQRALFVPIKQQVTPRTNSPTSSEYGMTDSARSSITSTPRSNSSSIETHFPLSRSRAVTQTTGTPQSQ